MKKCKYCNNPNYSDEICFIHFTKDILMNNDLHFIKKWVDDLYLSHGSRRYSLNKTLFIGKSFPGLLNGVYPYLLKQKQIYKKGDKFLMDFTDYLLKRAEDNDIKIYPETLKTILKSVKVNIKYCKNILNETQFSACIKKQGYSLDKSLEYCFSKKRGDEMKEVIEFYRKRDYIIYSYLHHIPIDIVTMIVDILD